MAHSQSELDESLALRTHFPIIPLGRPEELEGDAQGSERLLEVVVSMPEVRLERTDMQRRGQHSRVLLYYCYCLLLLNYCLTTA